MSIASKPRFTDKQGQYLAFIHTYAMLHRRPPAEADMQAYFGVTPPSVHRMVVELDKQRPTCGRPRIVPTGQYSVWLRMPTAFAPAIRQCHEAA